MDVNLPSDATCLREGVRFDLYRTEVAGPDGRMHVREFVHTLGSVVILPVLDDGRVVLIRNRRPATDQILWEFPAGTLEVGEDPAECAGRELIEETGFEAKSIKKLTAFFPSPGLSNEFMHAYRADGLTEVGQDLDDAEEITVHPVTRDEALAMIQRGEIADAKSVAVLLFDQVFQAGD